jgi:hypothetical protein
MFLASSIHGVFDKKFHGLPATHKFSFALMEYLHDISTNFTFIN